MLLIDLRERGRGYERRREKERNIDLREILIRCLPDTP